MDLRAIGLCALALLPACAASPSEESVLQQQVSAALQAKADTDRRNSRFTEYEDQWRTRIESAGRANYPEEARGRIHGSLRLTVSIRKDGSVASTTIDRSSGHEGLDRAALRIVELAAPFPAFPPEIAKDTDLLVITRTWFFGAGDSVVPR